jgi:metal-dependent amidase/aminoacylase/carboxypeptidase family protein
LESSTPSQAYPRSPSHTGSRLLRGAPGHGCGHNIHGTSGMAGAIAVKVALEEAGIPGTVRFYGCPAEETLVGKVWLVRDGYFEGVDAVLSHHPGQANTAGLASSNAMNSVKFHFYGVSSHAAGSPEQGRSALDAVELMGHGHQLHEGAYNPGGEDPLRHRGGRPRAERGPGLCEELVLR